MRRLVLGTAGHIDHGKTALVRALTGVDTDRLPEEKRRGLTIDLGFAELRLADDLEASIIDVPGHEAFVRNMVAGATGIDLVLFVIAADEGVMPQTREHLAIIELLGIDRGVIALTKSDLVDDEWLELVRDDVASLLDGSTLAAAPIIPVSARTGAGLDALTDQLTAVAHQPARLRDTDLFRMPIDRVFTVRGTGTVVTGTVWSGSLARDQPVSVLPAGITARLRGMQQHGRECDRITAGSRAAIALAGVDRHALSRGDTVVDGSGWSATYVITVDVGVLASASAPLRPRQRVRIHLGTAEVIGRLAMVSQPLEPGSRAIVQLRLEQPLLARAGDRFVIRTWSPAVTVAGGIVLEPVAIRRRRLDSAVTLALRQINDPATALTGALALAGAAGIDRAAAPVLTGLTPEALATALQDAGAFRDVGGRLLSASDIAECRRAVTILVAAAHEADPLADGIERELLRRGVTAPIATVFDVALTDLVEHGEVVLAGNMVALSSHEPMPAPAQRDALDAIAALFAEAGLLAPEIHELPAQLRDRPDLPILLRHLERNGLLVRLSAARWCRAADVDSAAARLRGALGDTPHPVAAYKDTLGLTRKHLMPLLEFFDRSGVSRRDGDMRTLLIAEKP